MKLAFWIFFIYFFSASVYSQGLKEMTIVKTDNTKIKTVGVFVYEKSLIKSIRYQKTKETLKKPSLENISKVIVDKEVYLVKEFLGERYLFLEVISGSLSLYKCKKRYFLWSHKSGVKEVEKKYEDFNGLIFKKGIVSVFINHCKSATNELKKNSSSLSLRNLKKVVNIYNSCNISSEIQIADQIIEELKKPIEKIKFGASLGLMNFKTDYNNLLPNKSDNLSLVSFGAKVYFFSNILDDKLNFNFAVDYFLKEQNKNENATHVLYNEVKLIKAMFGANYVFNGLSSKFKPYLGLSGGLFFNNSKVTVVSKSSLIYPQKFKTTNTPTYTINVGSFINFFNKKVDFSIEYQPSLDVTLLSTVGGSEPSNYYYTSLNFKLTYLF
jgi:hypothetical protein